jgi:transcriptional regulator with XRE-family HTH domain
MLSLEELDWARRRQAAGWSIATIAEHLDRSRTTVKAYLTGQRSPGPRAARADAFAPFADYTRQRMLDDPHLAGRALFGELQEIGYPGSYQTFSRALNQYQLRELRCPQCREPAREDYPAIAPPEHNTALPRPLAPVTGETLASYLARLAKTNHLSIADLLTALPSWFRTKVRNHDDRSRHHMLASVHDQALVALATLTNQTPAALLTALPAFAGHRPTSVRATTACHRCLAAAAIPPPVPVHIPAHQHICIRHRLWLSAQGLPQLDLTACPEITAAQRQAHALAQHHRSEHLLHQYLIAHHEIRDQPVRAGTDPPPNHWRSRLQQLRNMNPHHDTAVAHDEFVHASIYPEAIRQAAQRLATQQGRP